MNSKGNRASRSKNVQRGIIALLALLVIGTVFIGAGSAGSPWVVDVGSDNRVNLAELKDFPTTIKQGDKVTVEIVFRGNAANAYDKVSYSVTALGGMSGTLTLQNPSASWYLEHCGVSVSYGSAGTLTITPATQATQVLPCPSEIAAPVSFSGTINASGTGAVLAKLTLSGSAATDIDVPSDFYTTVSASGDFPVSKTITITYVANSGSSSLPPASQTPIPTATPTPTSQTIEVRDDGSVSFTAGGVSYGVELGDDAAGDIVVTPLGDDVKLPEQVLAGYDIAVSQPLTSGKVATVSMGISKSKLPSDVADVVMQHFNEKNGQWEDLPTTYRDDGTTVRYFGETDSFSPFVLVEKENGANPIPTATPTTTEPVETETPASPGFGILAALAGLGAVAILRRT